MKDILKKIIYKHKYSSEAYIQYLKNKGMRIGKGTVIFAPRNVTIDETRPWLIEIGNNVQITKNVTILTHGYDWSVLKEKYGDVLGSSGKVKIGDNCFIGMNATILKGINIGKNVIIGANSLVNKDVPDNVVIAGNPAKVIMTIEEYYEKRKKQQLGEAISLAKEYYKVYQKKPPKNIFHEYFWLFEIRDENILEGSYKEVMNLVNNYDQSIEKFKLSKPIFGSYEEFLNACELDK